MEHQRYSPKFNAAQDYILRLQDRQTTISNNYMQAISTHKDKDIIRWINSLRDFMRISASAVTLPTIAQFKKRYDKIQELVNMRTKRVIGDKEEIIKLCEDWSDLMYSCRRIQEIMLPTIKNFDAKEKIKRGFE